MHGSPSCSPLSLPSPALKLSMWLPRQQPRKPSGYSNSQRGLVYRPHLSPSMGTTRQPSMLGTRRSSPPSYDTWKPDFTSPRKKLIVEASSSPGYPLVLMQPTCSPRPFPGSSSRSTGEPLAACPKDLSLFSQFAFCLPFFLLSCPFFTGSSR